MLSDVLLDCSVPFLALVILIWISPWLCPLWSAAIVQSYWESQAEAVGRL